RAGCLVLDVRMPGISGPELMDLLNRSGASIPIIFLSAHGDVPLTVRAMKGGAFDFLQKPYNNQEFLDRVRQALAQDLITRSLRKRLDAYSTKLASLTLRERQIMERVVDGQSNKLIARELGISYKTVEAHRSRLMRKMGAASFAELLQQVLARN
ncbi:MAG: LuxR C-terminal-related transcriptional regulator, partial [Proteobacteria bacterium]|nr:LuxR C-terminal-related transcriptional regulator [Pseudomonadota bacterium]